jgi:hypothetical protein
MQILPGCDVLPDQAPGVLAAGWEHMTVVVDTVLTSLSAIEDARAA